MRIKRFNAQPSCDVTSDQQFLSSVVVLYLPSAMRTSRWFNIKLTFTCSGTVMKLVFKNMPTSHLRRVPYLMSNVCNFQTVIICNFSCHLQDTPVSQGEKTKVLSLSLYRQGVCITAGTKIIMTALDSKPRSLTSHCFSGSVDCPSLS